jgi:two-component system response regulator
MTERSSILLVEDNDDDAELASLAFARAKIANSLVRVRDGVEALDYLFGRGAHAARDVHVLPLLVLLDMKLPRLDGIDVLKAIRADERTRYLPVVALTSSIHDRDRLAAYQYQVNSYVKKPVDYDEFVEAARQIGRYWIDLNLRAPASR